MASGDLNKEIKRISQLTQYKNASKATVEKVANINIWKRQIKIGDKFEKECDKKLAEKLFGDYLDNYEFDSFSDLNTLADLIFEEVLKFTIQTQINKTLSDESNKYIPEKLISSLHDVEEKVLTLKDMLGINKKEDQKDDLTALQMLQKRFDKYIEFNRNEFTMTCIAEDSLILMSDWTTKKIQDVKIGDEIFGVESYGNYSWNLKKQKVLNFYDKGIQEVFKIKCRNKNLELTPDHRILAGIGRKGSKAHQFKFFNAYDCYDREAKVFNYINNLDDYYKGVLIGFIDSDGHIRQNKDKKHPNWNFEKQYNITQKVEHKAVEWILNYFNFVNKRTWQNQLTTFGGTGVFKYYISTQHSEFISNIYKEMLCNIDVKMGYLCGFLLGDGNRDSNNSWNITQSLKVNKQKCDYLIQLLQELQISFTTSIQKSGEILNIKIGSIRLPLKCPESKKIETWNKYLATNKPLYSLDEGFIKIVSGDYTKRVYDLTTETENFIVNGFVVHNCPDCGSPTLLRRRTKDFDVLKHPFFCGRFYYNSRGMSLVKAGIWDKYQYAWVFHTHPDYVDWCIKHEGEIPDVENFTEEEIKEFISKNPFLRKDKIPENILAIGN
jgi:hypothetical protein